jgi:hypothetical protein
MPGLPTGGAAAIAVLEPKSDSFPPKFVLYKIDGVDRGIGNYRIVELTPGRRSVTFGVNLGSYRGNDITRYFTAEAGKKYWYVFDDDVRAMRWTFSIVEQDSGRRVDSSER